MERLFWICIAGALGTGVRYLLGVWVARHFGTSFPYGTLIVNVAGCFFIAAIMQAAVDVAMFPPKTQLALTHGLAGGLTTYSTFAYETAKLAKDGARAAAVLNFAVTTAACFAAVLLGVAAASAIAKT
jgi:CrcB protein